MLKISLIAATSCLVFAGAASAQTLYGFNFRATDSTPWAGPYIGIHGGYALDDDDIVPVRPGNLPGNVNAIASGNRPGSIDRDKDGYVAGGQAGWNVQSGALVAGVEGDFSATDLSGRGHDYGLNGDRSYLLSRNTYLATVRGRVGWATSAGLLLYGTGGFATTEIKNQALFRGPLGAPLFAGVHEYHPDGWAAGAGVEYAIPTAVLARYGGFLGHSAITTRAEWLHYEFNGKDLNIAALPGGAGGYVARFDNQEDVIRAGINYKF